MIQSLEFTETDFEFRPIPIYLTKNVSPPVVRWLVSPLPDAALSQLFSGVHTVMWGCGGLAGLVCRSVI